jgi:hypothetical protein
VKTFWNGGITPPFLISALDGGEWRASCPGRLIPGEGGHVTNWIGGWAGSSVGLEAMKKISTTDVKLI